jgi:hypothetical protein
VARVHADGTLDAGFNPGPNGLVSDMALQADGRIVLAGEFSALQPNATGPFFSRLRVARLNANGTVTPDFDPSANQPVNGLSIQADGKVLIGGAFATLQPNGASGVTRLYLARLLNDPATQALSAPDS